MRTLRKTCDAQECARAFSKIGNVFSKNGRGPELLRVDRRKQEPVKLKATDVRRRPVSSLETKVKWGRTRCCGLRRFSWCVCVCAQRLEHTHARTNGILNFLILFTPREGKKRIPVLNDQSK